MFDYGIENVRGGSYTKITLDDWQLKALEHEFLSMGDKCFKCKKSGHIARYRILSILSQSLKYKVTIEPTI